LRSFCAQVEADLLPFRLKKEKSEPKHRRKWLRQKGFRVFRVLGRNKNVEFSEFSGIYSTPKYATLRVKTWRVFYVRYNYHSYPADNRLFTPQPSPEVPAYR
jgi:hypothetical protein